MPNQPKDPKPTLGPWIKKFYKDGETWGVRQSPEAPSVSLEGENISCGFSICNMVDNGDATEANADLIVTARDTVTERDRLKESHVELVKALRQTEIILTLIFGETGEDHISNYALDCRNVTVRPAIAKATKKAETEPS